MYLEIIEILLRGFCVGVAASITVGPVAVLCIQRTLSKSRRSGIVSGLGVAAADTTMAMIAYFCYSMLQAQIDQYNQLLRVIAGIFVVIVGVYIFFQTRYRRSAATGPARPALRRTSPRFSALRSPISCWSFPTS